MGPQSDGISALVRDTRELAHAPSSRMRTRGHVSAVRWQLPTRQKGSQNETCLAASWIWDLPGSKGVRDKFLLFKPPNHGNV